MFWVTAFLALLIPCLMVFIGVLWKKHPPKKRNSLYGYRTRRSMKNIETWNFAQDYFGKIWFQWGIVLGLFTVVVMVLFFAYCHLTSIILLTVDLIALFGSLIPVETALKRNFTEDGQRKEKRPPR